MIIVDRVFCDFCQVPMGQLFTAPVQAPDLLADQRVAPYFCACPDCLEAASTEKSEAA